MRVVIDACVLFPTVMREVVLALAEQGLFEPKWSERILEEWARAAAKLGPDGEMQARGEVALVKARFPKAIVPPHAGLEARLWLPDPADIHVLAAAVSSSADAILTVNAMDFPKNILAEEGLERLDPDAFLLSLHEAQPATVRAAAQGVRDEAIRLSGEDWTFRALMKKARLPRLGKALERG